MHHPNIVPVLGVAEHPITKDMLLARTDTLFFTRHNSCKTIIALTAKAGGCLKNQGWSAASTEAILPRGEYGIFIKLCTTSDKSEMPEWARESI